MSIPTMEGITATTITTSRLTTRVLFSGPEDGTPVLFLHGNVSSSTWWEETMLALPDGFRGVAPDQRGYGEADPDKKIDATRGAGDWVDDAVALLDHLGIQKAHVVGQSLGGLVVWRLMMDHSDRLLSVTQVDPASPYGFGGTKEADGAPCTPDFAGSGGGLVNPVFVQLAQARDRSTDSQFSPRNALRALVFKPPFIPAREEELLTALFDTHWGEQDYPGDAVPSDNWPGMAPGVWGPNNALSPKYVGDVKKIAAAANKVNVLWVRGANDVTVSDTAAADPGFLGQAGVLPGWPGIDAYPPQPMISQTRAVLEKYAAAGGTYKEVVIEDCGHTPYLEKPEAFNQAFHAHIA